MVYQVSNTEDNELPGLSSLASLQRPVARIQRHSPGLLLLLLGDCHYTFYLAFSRCFPIIFEQKMAGALLHLDTNHSDPLCLHATVMPEHTKRMLTSTSSRHPSLPLSLPVLPRFLADLWLFFSGDSKAHYRQSSLKAWAPVLAHALCVYLINLLEQNKRVLQSTRRHSVCLCRHDWQRDSVVMI